MAFPRTCWGQVWGEGMEPLAPLNPTTKLDTERTLIFLMVVGDLRALAAPLLVVDTAAPTVDLVFWPPAEALVTPSFGLVTPGLALATPAFGLTTPSLAAAGLALAGAAKADNCLAATYFLVAALASFCHGAFCASLMRFHSAAPANTHTQTQTHAQKPLPRASIQTTPLRLCVCLSDVRLFSILSTAPEKCYHCTL